MLFPHSRYKLLVTDIDGTLINNDGSINVLDATQIGQHWDETGTAGWISEDVNEDGTINVLDLIIIGQNWTG